MREEGCPHLVCWSRWRRWRSSGWPTLPPLLCSFFCFPLLSLLVLETPKAVATVSVTFLCYVFFFVCVSPGFPSPVRFPLFVLPVSLPSSQFLSPVLGPCSLWFWFLLCPLFFLVSVPCVIRPPLVLYFHCSPFLLPVSPLSICLFSVFYALLVLLFFLVFRPLFSPKIPPVLPLSFPPPPFPCAWTISGFYSQRTKPFLQAINCVNCRCNGVSGGGRPFQSGRR